MDNGFIIKNSAAGSGVFDPRGSRQMDAPACPFDSLLAGIKIHWNGGYKMSDYTLVNLRCEYETNPLGVQNITPLFSWQVISSEMGGYQSAYQIVAASSEENLSQEVYDIWNTGKIISRLCYGISYAGAPLKSAQRVYWAVRIWNQKNEVSVFSASAWFEMGLLAEDDWKGNWLSFLGGLIGNGLLMRYSFASQKKKINKVRMYICCVGYYELRINGHKVGDKLLDPAATDYSKTLLYSSYDVTENIRNGQNVIGIILGSGWAGQPKVLAQLNIEYEDGSVQEEVTDWGIGWCVAKGPILYNSIYDGEDYDARLEKDGWDTPEYETVFLKEHQRPGGWILATVAEHPGGKLTGELLPPIKIVKCLVPKYVKTLEDGRLLYDAGMNLTGWVKLEVSGERGAKVEMSFAEELNEQGDLDKVPLRLARCKDSYILRGDKRTEEYAPRFTYHGFRYFTVEQQGNAEIHHLTVEHIRSDLSENAIFQCDNDLLNRMAKVMKHTDACNLMGIPTDSSQRDERHGWTTDTTSRAEGCTYHFDMGSFFEKWARDVYDTQDKKGYFADTAPFRWGRRPCDPQVNTPISLILLMYQMYGNKRIVEESYEGMIRYLKALLKEADQYLISRTGFGEWACPKGECYPEEYGAGAVSKNVTATLVSTAYLYYSISQIKQMAVILGNGDAAFLDALQKTVFEKYNSCFYNENTGQYDKGSQSANALSLDLGLVPEEECKKVVANIVNNVKEHQYHMTTGNMGTKSLIEVLCRNEKDDEAYRIMTSTTSPGFGYMLAKGATTIWERWEADRDNNIMNSRNHPMLAAACVWFYKYLGGIQIETDKQGLQKLKIVPSVPEELNRVEAEMNILNGHVKVSWKKEQGKFVLNVTIPFNTSAKIHFPKKCGKIKAMVCNGVNYKPDKEEETASCFIYETGSGNYIFTADNE